MTRALLAIGAAAVAAMATRWTTASLIPATRTLRRNHRGVPVPTGLGVAVLAGITAGVAFIALVRAIAPHSPTPAIALAGSFGVLILGFGFGTFGLGSDVAAPHERGWRAHFPALAKGNLTPPAFAIAGGGMLALVIGAATSSSFGWALANAAIIALMAGLFGALDVRPGRAGKAYLVAVVPLTILGKGLMVPLAATLGAVAAFLAYDLRERAMLGDAGANALGAIAGGAIVAVDPPAWFVLTLLAALVALNGATDGPGLSTWIDRISPLRSFDRLGRVPDAPEMGGGSRPIDRNPGDGNPGGGGGELLH